MQNFQFETSKNDVYKLIFAPSQLNLEGDGENK